MWRIGILLLFLLEDSEAQTTAGRAFFQLASDERTNHDLAEPWDRDFVLPSYDFIIVGAGAAGAVLASRLTENPEVNVLLIEAGQPESASNAIPGFNFFLRKTDTNWAFTTEPDENYCRGLENGRCNYPRGKSMGGTTAINNGINSRGNRRDYDLWASMGNLGWDYNNVLPYFKKLENLRIPGDKKMDPIYHGYHGPVEVTQPYTHPLLPFFIEAGRENGWPAFHDYNAAEQIGFSQPQNIMKDGARLSSSRAYLHPHRHRSNLHVTKYSLVTEILFSSPTEACGVAYEKNNRTYIVQAKREVLVSAGTINSPQLLMLSGIGPQNHLVEKKIFPIRADLPVGENLQDHYGASGIVYETSIPNPVVDLDELVALWRTKREGPLTSFGVDWALIDTTQPGKPDGWADIEIIAFWSDNNPEILKDIVGYSSQTYNEVYSQPIPNHVLLTLAPVLLRPKSSGRILLRDRDPHSAPLIYPDYWKDPEDLKTLIRGVRESLKLGETLAFKSSPFNATLRTNRPSNCQQEFMSDSYIECLAKEMTMTLYHYTGTCGMGRVVDERLKVKGIERLRVVDASVLPTSTTGHTSMPTYMVAEKAADLIKLEWGF